MHTFVGALPPTVAEFCNELRARIAGGVRDTKLLAELCNIADTSLASVVTGANERLIAAAQSNNNSVIDGGGGGGGVVDAVERAEIVVPRVTINVACAADIDAAAEHQVKR